MNAIVRELGTEAMTQWFEHMHSNPELSMQEDNTAAFIAETLRGFGGFEVETGIGKHGIVASLKVGDSDRAIGLRADFDALPIQEDNDFPYKSTVDGVAHLCGHDDHMTMLLGAAKHLAETKNFNGTVRLIFQPGKETTEGGPAMIEDGLFERFPVDAIFGMHNIPGLDEGKFYFHPGEMMAAVDNWEIEIIGKGGHGGIPELTIDPGGRGLVHRHGDPGDRVAQCRAGAPGCRHHRRVPCRQCRKRRRRQRYPALFRAHDDAGRPRDGAGQYPPHRRSPVAILRLHLRDPRGRAGGGAGQRCGGNRQGGEIAQAAFGEDQVVYPGPSFLASEDFAFMLQKKKGTYCFLGSGPGKMVHHPQYFFNRDILPVGAAYWVALTEGYLR